MIIAFHTSSHSIVSPDAASSNKHSLLTGLSKMLVLFFSFTLCTIPLESGNVSTTLPMSQELRGEELSTSYSKSQAIRFLLGLDHFWRSWRRGRYSRIHLVQNKSARYLNCFYRFLVYVSSLLKMPGGMLG